LDMVLYVLRADTAQRIGVLTMPRMGRESGGRAREGNVAD